MQDVLRPLDGHSRSRSFFFLHFSEVVLFFLPLASCPPVSLSACFCAYMCLCTYSSTPKKSKAKKWKQVHTLCNHQG
jgi:hypothetical protein